MARYEILQYPDQRLRAKAKTVSNVKDPAIQKVIDNMFETLYTTENCAGLAATQLSIEDPHRITVIDVSEMKNHPMCLVNPEIIERSGEITEFEACMSVWPEEIHDRVTRATHIKFRALDRDGNVIEDEVTGILAKCIQHEVDHLNGKLYIDHLSALKRERIDKKIHKLRKHEE
jgi:peptide deformylase